MKTCAECGEKFSHGDWVYRQGDKLLCKAHRGKATQVTIATKRTALSASAVERDRAARRLKKLQRFNKKMSKLDADDRRAIWRSYER